MVFVRALLFACLVFASEESMQPGFAGKTFEDAKNEAKAAVGEVAENLQEAVFARYLQSVTEIPESGDYTLTGQSGLGFNLELSEKATDSDLVDDLKQILGSGTVFDANQLPEQWYPSSDDSKCGASEDKSSTGDGCWVNYSESDLGKFWYIEVAANTWNLPERKLNVATFVAGAKSKAKKTKISSISGFSEFHSSSKIELPAQPTAEANEHHFHIREEMAIGEQWVGENLPDALDLRPGMPAIRSQSPHGTCVAFSVADALAFSAGTSGVPLSPRWIYSARARGRNGRGIVQKISDKLQGEGMDTEAAIDIARSNGVPFELSIPYNNLDRAQTFQELQAVVNGNSAIQTEVQDGINGVGYFAGTGTKKPGKTVFLWFAEDEPSFEIEHAHRTNGEKGSHKFQKHKDLIKWVMNHFGPILISTPVWSDAAVVGAIRAGTQSGHGSYRFWKRGKLSFGIGKHQVLLVAYNANGAVIRNHWGTRWGDNGYKHIPWEEVAELHRQSRKWHAFMPPATQGNMPVPLRPVSVYPNQKLPSSNLEGSCVRENNVAFENEVTENDVSIQECSAKAKTLRGVEGFYYDQESQRCVIYFQQIDHADPSTEEGKTFKGICAYLLPGPRREMPRNAESKVGSEKPITIVEQQQQNFFLRLIDSKTVLLFFILLLFFQITKYCFGKHSTSIEKKPLLDSLP